MAAPLAAAGGADKVATDEVLLGSVGMHGDNDWMYAAPASMHWRQQYLLSIAS